MDRGTKRRLAGLTAALLLVTPLSVLAAKWQWSRHLERDELNAAVIAAETAKPVPWQSIMRDFGSWPSAEWRRVTADGTWMPEQQLLVRKQVVGGEVGFSVFTPLLADDGTALCVLRGWVPNANTPIPAPPAGEVHVIMRIRTPHVDGEIRPSDLPAGQVNYVDPDQMEDVASGGETRVVYPMGVDTVFELLSPVPDGLVALPWPELTSGPHVSYFVQWILIGLTGVVVYVRVFRSEWRLSHESAEEDPEERA